MYDTRLARRWNLDPVDQISISNYATFANSPLWKNDVKGNTTVVYNLYGKYVTTIFDNLSLEVHFIDDTDHKYNLSSIMNPENINEFRKSSFAFIGSNTISQMQKIHNDANNYVNKSHSGGIFNDQIGKELGFKINVTKSREIEIKRLSDEYGSHSSYKLGSAIKEDNWNNLIKGNHGEKTLGAGHVHFGRLIRRTFETQEEKYLFLATPTPPEYNSSSRMYDLNDYNPAFGGDNGGMLMIISEDRFSIYRSLGDKDRLLRYNASDKVNTELKPLENRDYFKYKNFKNEK